MDIERALFRSYEASLFSCVHDNPRRSCKRTQALCCIELVFLSLGLSLALVLVQASMIRSPLLTDLLVAKLEYDMHHINASSTNSSSSTVFLEETVMYLSLQGEFTPAYVFSLSKETGRMGATLLMQHDFPIIHANVSLCSTQFKGICEWVRGCCLLSRLHFHAHHVCVACSCPKMTWLLVSSCGISLQPLA